MLGYDFRPLEEPEHENGIDLKTDPAPAAGPPPQPVLLESVNSSETV